MSESPSSTHSRPSDTPAAAAPSPTIRAVAFDLDGLMFNTEAVFNRSLTELLARRGKPAPPELFAAMMGRRAVDANRIMIEMMELDLTVSELEAEISDLFTHHLDDMLQPMPGLMELLDHLEATGRPKAVCTSSGRDYAGRMLDRYGLRDRFAFLMGAEDVTNGKPHPEIYATAITRFAVDPAWTLVLEDAAHGVASGKAAGAYTVAVPHEFSLGQTYEAADLVIDSLADKRLLALLG